ncbi:hypothetical protein AgCh_001644 [Apium graveolens]
MDPLIFSFAVYCKDPTGLINYWFIQAVTLLLSFTRSSTEDVQEKALVALSTFAVVNYKNARIHSALSEATMLQSVTNEEDEGELINNDGFVYKRNKRPRLDITAATSAPPPDPLVEDNNRKIRRRNALLKLKEKYQAELSRWELLSNTLRDLNL